LSFSALQQKTYVTVGTFQFVQPPSYRPVTSITPLISEYEQIVEPEFPQPYSSFHLTQGWKLEEEDETPSSSQEEVSSSPASGRFFLLEQPNMRQRKSYRNENR
jgi:hypothetical protein